MNTILFDLDGTLLPIDQTTFVESYMYQLGAKFIPLGYDSDSIIKAVWHGTKAMILNDGSMTNEQRFWDTFAGILGEDARQLETVFENFYKNEFDQIKNTITPNPLAKYCVDTLKQKGYTLVLSTNPLFPKVATHARLAWAGLHVDDFALITTYENSSFSKPNLDYYSEILTKIGKNVEDCIMAGNDILDDMCVLDLGMASYLITDHIVQHENTDLSKYVHGSFKEFTDFVDQLPMV